MTLNSQRHTRVASVVRTPLGSHLHTSGSYNFWVEVEAHGQLERIIAKLERKLVEGLSGSDGDMLLAKCAQMLVRQLQLKIESDRLQNFKFYLLQHVSVVTFAFLGQRNFHHSAWIATLFNVKQCLDCALQRDGQVKYLASDEYAWSREEEKMGGVRDEGLEFEIFMEDDHRWRSH